MSEWKPQVVKIENVEKHPDADNLEIATILENYPVIIKTGQYKVNDLAAYICIDSIVPDTEDFYFLCPKAYEKYEENGEIKQRQIGNKYNVGFVPEKYRIIKAKKLRGIYSMGMLVDAPKEMNLGDSIVEFFNLKKWEEEVDDDVEFNGVKVKTRGGNAASPPKGWSIPYYDIESLRKYTSLVENEQDIILTEKINGSNSSFCHDGEQLWVKSRNYYKKYDEQDMWWDLAVRYDLANKLIKYPMKVFFCECAGQVKKFRYEASIENGKLLTKAYFFDIFDVNTGKYLDYDEYDSIITELDLPTAPLLYRGPWLGKDIMFPYAEGKSTLNENTIREGFVLRLAKEKFEPRLGSRLQLKLVSENYTLNK